jgi:hypothetical protein
MRYEEMKIELAEEFPELGDPHVLWEKEVFAHFGLLFMGIGLLEHALINAVMLTSAAKEFASERGKSGSWAELIDRHFEQATQKTFGNLKKALCNKKGFESLDGELTEVKKLRDYFAHHFMRVDSDLMSQPSGCILLIHRLWLARSKIKAVEVELEAATARFFIKIDLPPPTEIDVQAHLLEMKAGVNTDLESGAAEVGWMRNAL